MDLCFLPYDCARDLVNRVKTPSSLPEQHNVSLSSLLRLAVLVFIAVSFVVVGDTAGKLLTTQGVDPVLVAWSRFFIAVVILLPFSGLSRAELRHFCDWRIALRGGLITFGIFFILNALKTEPIANVFGAFFIGPVVSYILAILFLGEPASRLRSLLLGVGFIGVMFVVKPGFGGGWGMGFALAAGICYGSYLAMTRLLAASYRPKFLLMSHLLIGSVVLAPMGLSNIPPQLSLSVGALIVISAFGSALGNYLLVIANRSAQASLIAPLVYSQLISATLAGVLVFSDWPDIYALFGLCLITLSGFGSLLAQPKSPADPE